MVRDTMLSSVPIDPRSSARDPLFPEGRNGDNPAELMMLRGCEAARLRRLLCELEIC